jgi:raffinose/stachyose/melibiose transport system permease protein
VRTKTHLWLGVLGIVLFAVVFLVPFVFILFTAAKTQTEAGELQFSLPTTWALLQNFGDALRARDYMLVIAFINSIVLTVVSITVLVVLSAMVAYVVQRRQSRWSGVVNFLVLCGLIIPPAVVPTVWVLQSLGLFKTLTGLMFIEIAFGLAFCILLFQAFIATIPRDLDEAAIIDFNDFANPLYFLPGDENATVQLTVFNFQSQFSTQYNLLFADILLITIPPLLLFLFLNKRIVEGMTAGAVKG